MSKPVIIFKERPWRTTARLLLFGCLMHVVSCMQTVHTAVDQSELKALVTTFQAAERMALAQIIVVGVDVPADDVFGVPLSKTDDLTDIGLSENRDVLIITTRRAYEAALENDSMMEFDLYRSFDFKPGSIVVLRQCKGLAAR